MRKLLLTGFFGLIAVCPVVRAQEDAKAERAALVPVLIAALSDADAMVRTNAGDALASLGPIALPKLKELLSGTDKKLRVEAARVLGKMAGKGHRTSDMLPPLVKVMKDEDVELRREASLALSLIVAGRIASGSDKPLPKARIVNPNEVYDVINRNKGKMTLDWPSDEIQKQAGADAWGDWRPAKGDVGEVIAVCNHPLDPTVRVYILRIGKYYVPMADKGIEILP